MAHDSQTVEIAYQVWAFEAGRSCPRTRDILARDHEIELPIRTIQHWASSNTWAERVNRDLASIAPDIRNATIGELIMGALEGARTLRRSVADPVYLRDADGNIETDRNGNPLMQPKPDKTEVTAALGLLDRGGFGHIGSGAVASKGIATPVSALAGVDVDSLGIEELLQLQSRILDADRVKS